MDLIDMRSIGDGEYKWILHTKDHFTKFSWCYPLKTKEAEPVAEKLLQQFYLFGAPRILQSDNGKEFVAKVIRDLKKTWPDLIIINGRPRHPQTQGLVERGNQTLESALGKWMESNNRKDWSNGAYIHALTTIYKRLLSLGLPQVIYSINTSSAKSTDKSPYEVVFGQKARCDIAMWQVLSDQGILDEEDLPYNFMDGLKECQEREGEGEVIMSSNIGTSSTFLEQTPQTLSNFSLSPASPPVVHIPSNKKRRQARLFSNDEFLSINKGETSDSSDTRSVNNHQQIRAEAEASYMANIVKRQKLFNNALRKHEYKVGNLVGLKIDKVDRTNVTPKILPCKIISIQSASNDMDTYQLCTTTCVISSRFQVLDLLDLSNCNFRDLREVDSTALPTMTFIQACKAYVNAGLVTPVEVCNCNGNCSTKKCSCRQQKYNVVPNVIRQKRNHVQMSSLTFVFFEG
ncbi:unnamed protein product [Rotaria sp. Silwood1]|nr:unnamed protein product [Rotaria sp. Silwood1]CAF4754645.1 unnamed protein product [Rotaria sp. Silwood1]